MYKASEKQGAKGAFGVQSAAEFFGCNDAPPCAQRGPRKAAAAARVSLAIHESTRMALSLFRSWTTSPLCIAWKLGTTEADIRLQKSKAPKGLPKGPSEFKVQPNFLDATMLQLYSVLRGDSQRAPAQARRSADSLSGRSARAAPPCPAGSAQGCAFAAICRAIESAQCPQSSAKAM